VSRALGVLLVAVLSLAALFSGGCKRSAAASAAHDAGAPTAIVKDDSEGLLLTWIDDKGDFHVETKVGDVPIMGRDTVRVVDPRDPASGQMTGDDVVVADLRQAGADGVYPVHAMARTAFEALAVARREKTGPTLANPSGQGSAAPARGAAPDDPGSPQGSHARATGPVVIYGAEWCGACHEAAKYLRHKGIPYVDKDIEKDQEAAREMQQKLAKNGLSGGSIPVIDVRGKVMVGFNPAEIDAALGQAL
jgi:glutaredoxin